MSLTPWRNKNQVNEDQSALSPIERLRGEMDGLFDRFFDRSLSGLASSAFSPLFEKSIRLELADGEDHVIVRAELSGVEPKEVNVEVVGQALIIKAEKKREQKTKEADFFHSEVQYGSFTRSVQLPAAVDPAKVKAKHVNGVLTITIGKDPTAKPKRIPVAGE